MPSSQATHPNPNTDDPAPANKPQRPRLRGFSYLRGQSSSAFTAPSSTSATSERNRSSRFARSASPPAELDLDQTHIVDSTVLPSIRDFNQTEQYTYLNRLESALRPFPSPSNCECMFTEMARNRAGSAANGVHGSHGAPHPSKSGSSGLAGHTQDQMPTIRLIPHQDPRSNRPSLAFPATSRTLPHEDCVIRVGRYSERDANPSPPPNTPSSAPVGFKSKVVSRRHCEFWCSQGQWYIKDMKSSSGTFLNHIRLSAPSVESKPFPVHDGDVVQLGIDFRGGEEMIFRCVKIRVEVNRAWQKTLNNYNVQTHKRLRDLGRNGPKKDSDTASTHSSECSICLMSVAPCQSLFVAPCSHVWHYKCIRPILNDVKNYPQFMCPNCRAVTDLEADVDDPADDSWEDGNAEGLSPEFISTGTTNGTIPEHDEQALQGGDQVLSHSTARQFPIRDYAQTMPQPITSSDYTNGTNTTSDLLSRRGAQRISPSFITAQDYPVTHVPATQAPSLCPTAATQPLLGEEDILEASVRTPTQIDPFTHDGPMTPTNNAGPFVFDGSAGRVVGGTEVGSMSETDNASSKA